MSQKSFSTSVANAGVWAIIIIALFEFFFGTLPGFFLFMTSLIAVPGFVVSCGLATEFLGINIICPLTLVVWFVGSAIFTFFFLWRKGMLKK
jgi:hypothetical protein